MPTQRWSTNDAALLVALSHSNRAAMYTRVLYTNGRETIKLLWVMHKGSDVIYGFYGVSGHMSYHSSGQHHHTSNTRDHSDIRRQIPLRQLQGVEPLTSLNFRNTPRVFHSPLNRQYDPSRRKSRADAILMIDSRAIPDDRQVTIWIGLLEEGNGKALTDLMAKRKLAGTTVDSHLLIAMRHSPWVWASVSWISESQHQLIQTLRESR
jgi:hypothetical protein